MTKRGPTFAGVLVLLLLLVTLAIWQLAPRAIPHAIYSLLNRVDAWLSDCPRPNKSRYWTETGSGKTKLVVFVHGIFGDPTCTWTAAGEAESFLRVIQSHPGISRAFDVFSFGYPTGIFDEFALTPEQAAGELVAWLKQQQNYSEIVFVTHSMGALVALEAASSSRDVGRRTSMVLALSPPLEGSELAMQGKRVWLPNPALERLFPPRSADDYLRRLARKVETLKEQSKSIAKQTRAENQKRPIPVPGHRTIPELLIHCAGENRPSALGTLVVTEIRSQLCTTIRHLTRDHSSISKPSVTSPVQALADDPVSFVVGHLDKRVGPNPGVSVEINRVADFSEVVCAEGRRKGVEKLTDTYRFSVVPTDRLFLRASLVEGVSVSLVHLSKAAGEEIVHPLSPTEDLCLDTDRCTKLLAYGGLQLDSAEQRFRWEWRSDSAPETDGVNISSDYPITQFSVEVRLPPDATAHPERPINLARLTRGVSCRTPAGKGRSSISYLCRPVDQTTPLWGPVSLYFGDSVHFPKCP